MGDKNYFNEQTQQAIVDFQQEIDIEKRKKIFHDRIRYSFAKLIENIIFVYEFKNLENIEILENDCLSFLFECLSKFDATKGKKAFSYFNVVARNWFLQESKTRKKNIKHYIPITKELLEESEDRKKFVLQPFEEEVMSYEFVSVLQKEMKSWISKIKNQQEKKVLEAIVLLFDDIDSIQLYNKKGIYLYIREITKLNTKQVALNLMRLRKKYKIYKKKYFEGKL